MTFSMLSVSLVIQATSGSASFIALVDSRDLIAQSSPVMMDSNFVQLASAVVGQQVILSTTLSNTNNVTVEYVLFTEVRNENGNAILLGSSWGVLNSSEEALVRYVWRPEQAGIFELRGFVISADCNPNVLTPVTIGEAVVKLPDGIQKVTPRPEDLTREEAQQLTREEIVAIEFEDTRRDEISSEAYDAELVRIEAKELRLRELIWNDDRIKEYQANVWGFGYDSHFFMNESSFCDDAEMTIELTRYHHVEGDWQTKYISTYSGRSELKVSVVDGAISSIAENPLSDITEEYGFSEEEKKAIEIVLDYPDAKRALEGKEWYVGSGVRFGVYMAAYDCPSMGCGSVLIADGTKGVLHAFVDTERMKIVSMNIDED